MPRDFRDGLGAELRRAAAATTARPAAEAPQVDRRARRPRLRLPALSRPAAPAVAAVLAVVGGAALAVLPGTGTVERSGGRTAATAPRGADAALARQAELLGVLRRAPVAADGEPLARAALRTVDRMLTPRPAGVRLLGRSPSGQAFVLVPVASFPTLVKDRLRTTAPRAIEDGFCVVVQSPRAAGMNCWDADAIRSGAAHATVGARGEQAFGLVPDGVAFVRPRKGTRQVRVQDNFFRYDRPAHDYGRPLWFDADGVPITTGTRRGHRGPLGVPISASRIRLATADGQATTLARMLGDRRTVVTFTASWCRPCRSDADRLRRLEGEGVPVIAVARDDRASELAQTLGPDVMVVRDTRGELSRLLDAGGGVPATYLLDPESGIVEHRRGALRASDVESLLRAVRG